MTVQASRTAAILLAAGRSRRHPSQNKLTRPLDGLPMGLHAARAIAELAPALRIAVCSESTRALVPNLERLGFEGAWNDDPDRGLASSLAIGVRAALAHDVEAVLVCLGDMPFVTTDHLRALVARLDPSADVAIVGSRPAGTGTVIPPAAFAGDMIKGLLTLEGDRGAGLLLRHAVSIEASPGELADLDDPAAFAALVSSTPVTTSP